MSSTDPHSPQDQPGHHDQDRPGRGASVHVLPPVLFVVPFIALWLLDRLVPLTIPGGSGRTWAGVVLVALGVGLGAWGVLAFRLHHTTVIPHGIVSALVTNGPYRITRNPMYVGLALVYLGVSLVVATWWPIFALPFIIVAMYRLVIRHEEAYLGRTFGVDYTAYRHGARRWL